MSNLEKKIETRESERFLVFTLNGEKYALTLLKVKEVIALTKTTPMPYMPSYFKGIMNLRGKVISVIDLRLKFKMKESGESSETTIIILDIDSLSVGVVVDSVDFVLSPPAEHIQPAPDVEGHIGAEYVEGVVEHEEKLVLIVDIEKTVNANEIKHHLKKSA
ncbi:MAG: chemotaxis protein CheW [Bacteriovoracaceae bacterium]